MDKARTISQVTTEMIAYTKDHPKLTIRQLMEMLHGRSIALVLLPFCLLNSIPIPSIPGFSTVTGIPIVILGFQMLCRSKSLWLPGPIAEHPLKPKKWASRLQRLLPRLKRMEKMLKPRWLGLSSPTAQRLLGLVFIGLGIVLALPLPFMNFPVGFAMSLLAVGIVLRDGVLIMVSLLLTFGLLAGGYFMLNGIAG